MSHAPERFQTAQACRNTQLHLDRQTGEILATETRWTDEGAEPGGVGRSRNLLASIHTDSGRTPKDLDVLAAKAGVTQGAQRIDVQTRKVVSAKIDEQTDTQVPDAMKRA